MALKFRVTSFEDASLLRKITILYFLMSIVPISFLYFLYLQYLDYGKIVMQENQFAAFFAAVVIGVALGYFLMRTMVINIIKISKESKVAVTHILGGDTKPLSRETTDEIAVLAESFKEITDHLEENVRSLERAKRTLHSVLAKVGEGMSSLENIDSFLNLIVETVTEALEARRGFLFLVDDKRQEMYIKAIYGDVPPNASSLKVVCKNKNFSELFETRKPVILSDIPDPEAVPFFKAPVLCAPLILHDHVSGIICTSEKISGKTATFDTEEKNLLNNLALQTAVAVENSRLNEDAEKTYFETISALALAVEAKDPHSRGHSDRVANLCVEVGRRLNIGEGEVKILRDAAKLHDIGKIGVMDNVLKKDGPLTEQEERMMHKHPAIGEGIIKPIRSLRPLSEIVRHHHEKLDGSGYPDGIKGDAISTLVRILTVADIFDALISDRPYRQAFTPQKAIEELRRQKNELDQKVVDVLSSIVPH